MLPKPDQARQLLAVVRIALGASAWLAPRPLAWLLGHRLDDHPSAGFLVRLFGSRDVVMGLALLQGDDTEVRRWLTYGMAIDTADMAATIAAGLGGRLSKPRTALITLATLGGVALNARARGDI